MVVGQGLHREVENRIHIGLGPGHCHSEVVLFEPAYPVGEYHLIGMLIRQVHDQVFLDLPLARWDRRELHRSERF